MRECALFCRDINLDTSLLLVSSCNLHSVLDAVSFLVDCILALFWVAATEASAASEFRIAQDQLLSSSVLVVLRDSAVSGIRAQLLQWLLCSTARDRLAALIYVVSFCCYGRRQLACQLLAALTKALPLFLRHTGSQTCRIAAAGGRRRTADFVRLESGFHPHGLFRLRRAGAPSQPSQRF